MNPVRASITDMFPRAWSLSDARRNATAVGEARRAPDEFADPPSERLIQCVWYDPSLRPSSLRTADGEPVTVVNPGVWNLEAGPDFLGASLRLGRGDRILAGDVEVHIRPTDWARHRHRDDARYGGVRFHVTYHPGPPSSSGGLPPGIVRIALRDALASAAGFSFESIDASAYPFAVRPMPTPCSLALVGWHPDDREELLERAGVERLRRKAERLARRIADLGVEQAIYEELMIALGYKHNKIPFGRLAAGVPLADLRKASAGDAERAYAILLGAAGLMPTAAGPGADGIRRLWDVWWKHRTRWEGATLPRDAWRLDGLRPLNRPERRLRAAAGLVTREETPYAFMCGVAPLPPRRLVREMLAWLDVPDTGEDGVSGPGLLGRARATAILINVVVPALAAVGHRAPFDAGILRALPDEPSNGIERTMAHTLFGPDHPPSLHRGALRRQGLMQIFLDFCLMDRSQCASCGLPRLLQTLRGRSASA